MKSTVLLVRHQHPVRIGRDEITSWSSDRYPAWTAEASAAGMAYSDGKRKIVVPWANVTSYEVATS